LFPGPPGRFRAKPGAEAPTMCMLEQTAASFLGIMISTLAAEILFGHLTGTRPVLNK
jgi:hypothetical protein